MFRSVCSQTLSLIAEAKGNAFLTAVKTEANKTRTKHFLSYYFNLLLSSIQNYSAFFPSVLFLLGILCEFAAFFILLKWLMLADSWLRNHSNDTHTWDLEKTIQNSCCYRKKLKLKMVTQHRIELAWYSKHAANTICDTTSLNSKCPGLINQTLTTF